MTFASRRICRQGQPARAWGFVSYRIRGVGGVGRGGQLVRHVTQCCIHSLGLRDSRFCLRVQLFINGFAAGVRFFGLRYSAVVSPRARGRNVRLFSPWEEVYGQHRALGFSDRIRGVGSVAFVSNGQLVR